MNRVNNRWLVASVGVDSLSECGPYLLKEFRVSPCKSSHVKGRFLERVLAHKGAKNLIESDRLRHARYGP